MISENEPNDIIDMKSYYVVLPDMQMVSWSKKIYLKKGNLMKKKFSYRSDNNKNFLKVEDLSKLIKKLK